MKRIIFILLAVCSMGTVATAQTAMTGSGTLTNATTGYVTAKIASGYGNLAIQLNVVKTSGTVAGTAWLQASNDGTNYYTIATDTLALADVATNTKMWNVGISPYLYYRAKITTSGTQVSTGSGYYVFRQHP